MQYFAKLADGKVVAVHVISDSVNSPAEFLANLHGGLPEEWVETFTDGTRGKQASIGDDYEEELDVFVTPPEPAPEITEE
jgi:hypothetical protein